MDFVVVTLAAPFKETFSSCYVKAGESFTLWSKVADNEFFEEYCGEDYKDWKENGGFTVEGIYGVGIGARLKE